MGYDFISVSRYKLTSKTILLLGVLGLLTAAGLLGCEKLNLTSSKSLISYSCSESAICVIEEDGGKPKELPNVNVQFRQNEAQNPAINKEGQIAYQCDEQICLVNASAEWDDEEAAISLTGEIGFDLDIGCCRGYESPAINNNGLVVMLCHAGNIEVCVINSDGEEFARVTTNTSQDDMPAINDEGQITFVCYPSGQHGVVGKFHHESEICSVNMDGSDFRILTESNQGSWNPDINNSADIAYVCKDIIEGDICVINADGTNLRKVTDNDINEIDPAINSDGRIAFGCYDGEDWEICAVDSDGSDFLRLTYNEGDDMSPAINDEGLISFTCYEGDLEAGQHQICVINDGGTGFNKLTDVTTSGYGPSISP